MTADPADGDHVDNFPDRAMAEWFDAEIEVRRGKVLLMRLSGMTYAAIAGALNVSTATARKDYDIALAAHATDTPEKMIARQRALLTELTNANLRQALKGDKDAAAIMLRALDQEAKLFGLNAPTRVLAQVNTVDYSNEAAALIDKIKMYDPDALDKMFKPKELTRDRRPPNETAVIDAELEPDPEADRDGDTVAVGDPADVQPTDDSGDRPPGEAGGDDGTGDGFDPDDDSDWADV